MKNKNTHLPEHIKIPLSKRIFDIFFSIFLIIILSPIFLIVLLLLALEAVFFKPARRNFLYHETRVSQGEPFTLYKFNIFKKGIPEEMKKTKGYVDTKTLEHQKDNLTHVGLLLKKIYLDELPQLFSILKGDISFVGPRPTNWINYKKLFEEGYYSKYILKGGLTGYFQSHKGEKLHLSQEEIDMEYAYFCRDASWWEILLYDIKIIFLSVLTVLRAEGI